MSSRWSRNERDDGSRSLSRPSVGGMLEPPDPRALGPSVVDRMISGYAAWLMRWRWLVIVLTLAAVGAAASGARLLTMSSDYRIYFGPDNPQLQAYEALQNTYTKDDNVMFVLRPADGEVFAPAFLAAMRGLIEAAWKLPFATRVEGLNNFQHSYAEADDLTVRDLVPAGTAPDDAAIAEIRAVALNEPLLVDRLVAPDGRTAGVNVTVTLPQESQAETPELMAEVRALAAAFAEDYPGTRVAVIGTVPLGIAFDEAAQRDLRTLVPAMYVILLLVTVLLLRSLSGTVATLIVIGLSTAAAMGAAGWLGIKLTPASAAAPTVILTIAIADSIHVLVTMFHQMAGGADKRAAIAESLRVNFQPVFLTSVTTIIGFLSLNFGDSPPFHDLGNVTAIGVAAAWLFSIMFLPALMSVLPVRVAARDARRPTAMRTLADMVIRHHRPLLLAMTAVAVTLAAMIPRNQINDQFHSYFDDSFPFRQDVDFAADTLGGVDGLEWSLPAAGSGGISEPDYLRRLDAFAQWLGQQPHVEHVSTISDVLRRLNRNMHGDDPAYDRLPDNRELAAQYLLLFEMSLPYGLDLNNQIDVDKSASRVIARTDRVTTAQLAALDTAASAWLRANFPGAATVSATGPTPMFAYIFQRNIEGMLTGTVIALLLISATLMLALRDLKLGLISLVPNLLPAAMAFGIWAVFVAEVGLAASVITATSLGLIVDATVHFLSKYQRAQRRHGASAEDAIRYAFATVGTALWVTSAILIAGFAVMAFSDFKINAHMGLLTAMAIAAAVATDFLLLPALLLMLDRNRRRRAGRRLAPTAPAAAG